MDIARVARFLVQAATGMALLCLAVPAAAQDPIWRNDWTIAAPPTLVRSDPVIRFGADGDLLMATQSFSRFDGQVFRLMPSGQQRWGANIQDEIGDVRPATDGGAYVSTAYYDSVTRIDPDGAVGWSSRVPGQWIAQGDSNRVSAAGCNLISALEPQLGGVLWQYRVAAAQYPCALHGLVTDGSGGLYATFEVDSGNTGTEGRVIKLDETGHLVWRTSIADSQATPVGVDGSTLYVASAAGLSALNTDDGSLIWQSTVTATRYVLVPGTPAIPIAIGYNSVQGIDPATGLVAWTRSIQVEGVAKAVGDAFVVNSAVGLKKLNALTGAVEWTTALPASDGFGNPIAQYLALGGLDAGHFLAVGRAYAEGKDPPPFIQSIDFSSGQLGNNVTVSATTQGVLDASVASSGKIFAVGLAQAADGADARVRSLDASSGAVLWTNTDSNLYPTLANRTYSGNLHIAATSDSVAIAIAQGDTLASTASVSDYDASTGTKRWQDDLRPADQVWSQTYISDPVIDPDSNVLVGVGTNVYCDPNDTCLSQGLYKLSATDGSLLWQYDALHGGGSRGFVQLFPPIFARIDDDLVVANSTSLVRLSGASGTVEWTSDASAPNNIFEICIVDDGNIIVVGSGQWAKIDAATGATLWTGVEPDCATTGLCSFGEPLALPGGDLLLAGEQQGAPVVLLLRGDGSGDSDVWYPDTNPSLRSALTRVTSDSEGRIWMSQSESLRKSGLGIRFLARFDLATGSLVDEQALNQITSIPLADLLVPTWLAPPENDQLLVSSYVEQTPAPTTNGNALLDISVSAHGNLSVDSTIDPGPLSPGDIAHFEVVAHYEGNVPLTGVHLIVRTPWVVTSPNLFCFGFGATNCTGDLYSGDIRATFDIDPGGDLHLQGRVPVLDIDTSAPTIDAVVYGPTGLVEQNTLDNFAQQAVAQSLFHNGFDPRSN